MNSKLYQRDYRSPLPSSELASKVMSSIKGRNTKPEIIIRKLLFQKGFKGYRIHYKKIPGSPDIVFTRKRLAIFINGCYWHRCPLCKLPIPKSNVEFWENKFNKNVLRDQKKIKDLESLGWNIITIWECEIKKNPERVVNYLISYI